MPRKKSPINAIRVRGARQHNLKGFDVDIPLGKLTVVTGPSGSGKSSLAFHTLYAEGQRRYVETFSPYVRQFFDRMDKPAVEGIDGIPPAIAIEQKNNVRTTRSTVGTITEINDYLKLFFAHHAHAIDPKTGEEIRPDTTDSIVSWGEEHQAGEAILVTFPIPFPKGTKASEFFPFLAQQGYLRVLIKGDVLRTDDAIPKGFKLPPGEVLVIQDRLKISPRNRARLREAIEQALTLGKGRCTLSPLNTDKLKTGKLPSSKFQSFSTAWTNPATGFTVRPPTPALFTFNNPVGACPECRGFGRVIGIDLNKAIPDPSLSIRQGCVTPFQTERGGECQGELEHYGQEQGIDLDAPYEELTQDEQNWILYGERKNTQDAWENHEWYGVQGFFDWVETKAYKMHVRIYLSRFRSYTTCSKCRGARLQPDALIFQVQGHTLPDLWHLPINELAQWFEAFQKTSARQAPNSHLDKTAKLVLGEITSRLSYLQQVGLSYLTLDRQTRTLSGGEIERVNLTTCLGASLSQTLFVLDEPTVGLHPRDVAALIGVMHGLRDKGNTLVVVEHEEAVMRAADHLLDLGPAAGEHGGHLTYQGPTKLPGSHLPTPTSPPSLTLSYLDGTKTIPVPATRRQPTHFLQLRGATRHNLRKLDCDLPLGVFACLTGVSGSGKSTLVHDVLALNLAQRLGEDPDETPAPLKSLHLVANTGAKRPKHLDLPAHLRSVHLVDQSPLSRTPRSTPAVYLGAFEPIRQLFATSPEGKLLGLTPGYFSFNSGTGRCERCAGNGFEKVEMQFLSDLYLTCPECEGSRYGTAALEIRYQGKNVAEILALTVTEALAFFAKGAASTSRRAATKEAGLKFKVLKALRPLDDLGLGYLRLGQALNTLSGGESQRIKLCQLLSESNASEAKTKELPSASGGSDTPTPRSLLILDEPTTGLHFSDIAKLLTVFQRLVDAGHSLLIIEHNLEVIKSADYLIDLGPGAGVDGGTVVAQGTPEEVAKTKTETARFLKGALKKRRKGAKVADKASKYRINQSPNTPKIQTAIEISGARHHNLKNIDLSIPHNSFVVVTGLSGSGKSTLAFDLIFAEGQRRFLDSMSPYARQFAEQLEKPDLDRITGLPPTVAIEQRISQGGGKSSVATVTEIYHFLRLLFAKLGIQHCPVSGEAVVAQTEDAILKSLRTHLRSGNASLLAPIIRGRKGYHTDVAEWAGRHGYTRLFVDQQWKAVDGFQRLARFKEHDIDVEVARISSKTKLLPLQDHLAAALRIGKGTVRLLDKKNKLHIFSTARVSATTGRSFEELDPSHFSFNSPRGWCKTCRGYGTVAAAAHRHAKTKADGYNSEAEAELDNERKLDRTADEELVTCPDCHGSRLHEAARSVYLKHDLKSQKEPLSLPFLAALTVKAAHDILEKISFTGRDKTIARDILPEITQRLRFLSEVGLSYLQLNRSAKTLSGGEAQRIRLAAQLGSNLRGVLYVLDEPTIGLHPRDNQDLLNTLDALRNKGNSLLIVEHDDETMKRADHIIDLGPGAGRFGGEIVASGKLAALKCDKNSVTGQTFKNPLQHPLRGSRRPLPKVNDAKGWLKLTACTHNNLKNINARLPLGRLTVISGISGCGKSSLMRGCLAEAAKTNSDHSVNSVKRFKSKSGFKQIKACYEVDQSPIGKTSRSCPATYVKLFDNIRKLFAQLPEARIRGFSASRFSFNNDGGRCPTCKGNGRIKLEMDFLPSTWTHCDTCDGKRYNPATLEVTYAGKSIGDVLEMSIDEAAVFFESHPKLHRPLQLLADTGLGYLQLGQPSPTVSGGEAQRIKLVSQLIKGRKSVARIQEVGSSVNNLYLIEEPSIGLHLQDVQRLIDVLHRLVDEGHTVVVIEHHTGLMAEADYLIDMGPEAGEAGGKIVAQGTPEQVAKSKTSRTAPFLREVL